MTVLAEEFSQVSEARTRTSFRSHRSLRPPVWLGGLPIDRLTRDEIISILARILDDATYRHVATANLDFLRLARKDEDLRRILRRADVVTADGMPLLWLARCAGSPIPERNTGCDLTVALLKMAAERSRSVFFLGGPGQTAQAAAAAAKTWAPGLIVAGTENGRIDETGSAQTDQIVQRIGQKRPDIVLVSLGTPKTERFLDHYGPRLRCRLAMGVGGAFAILAGKRRRAPQWLQRAGLEWAFRCTQEPSRLILRYIADALALPRLFIEALHRRNSLAPKTDGRSPQEHVRGHGRTATASPDTSAVIRQ